jgi:hypothetical protein
MNYKMLAVKEKPKDLREALRQKMIDLDETLPEFAARIDHNPDSLSMFISGRRFAPPLLLGNLACKFYDLHDFIIRELQRRYQSQDDNVD